MPTSKVPEKATSKDNRSVSRDDYYSVLANAIEKAEHNSAFIRALIYERARFNLKREALFGTSSLTLPEILQHSDALERAIIIE
jgi:hypothetical protein